MPDYSDAGRAAAGASGPSNSYSGDEAGNDQKFNDLSEQADWDAYKKENKLSFAASKAQHKDAFAAWRQKRKTGSSAATGSPIIKTGM